MSYTRERDEFISRMSREGMPLDVVTSLLRYASTLQRLAVAQCNGEWPCDNGQRKVIPCPVCEGGYVPSVIKGSAYLPKGEKACPDCRTAAAVTATLKGAEGVWRPVFGGDPRGAVLRLVPKDAKPEDVESGRERGIYVPARER